jgi:hypothetical protein
MAFQRLVHIASTDISERLTFWPEFFRGNMILFWTKSCLKFLERSESSILLGAAQNTSQSYPSSFAGMYFLVYGHGLDEAETTSVNGTMPNSFRKARDLPTEMGTRVLGQW